VKGGEARIPDPLLHQSTKQVGVFGLRQNSGLSGWTAFSSCHPRTSVIHTPRLPRRIEPRPTVEASILAYLNRTSVPLPYSNSTLNHIETMVSPPANPHTHSLLHPRNVWRNPGSNLRKVSQTVRHPESTAPTGTISVCPIAYSTYPPSPETTPGEEKLSHPTTAHSYSHYPTSR